MRAPAEHTTHRPRLAPWHRQLEDTQFELGIHPREFVPVQYVSETNFSETLLSRSAHSFAHLRTRACAHTHTYTHIHTDRIYLTARLQLACTWWKHAHTHSGKVTVLRDLKARARWCLRRAYLLAILIKHGRATAKRWQGAPARIRHNALYIQHCMCCRHCVLGTCDKHKATPFPKWDISASGRDVPPCPHPPVVEVVAPVAVPAQSAADLAFMKSLLMFL